MDTTPKMIVCYGDSNTHGYNAANMGRFSEKERWPCILDDLLGPAYLIREEGLSGRTTSFDDPLFEGLNGFSYLHTCLLTHEPLDLLVVMLGTNDVKERFSATPGNIAKGMERLANKAIHTPEAWRGQPNILIIAPPHIGEGYYETEIGPEMGKGCAEKSRMLAPLYKDLAGRLGCHFLDASTVPGVEMAPYDHMHLSLTAHEALAGKLADLIPRLC